MDGIKNRRIGSIIEDVFCAPNIAVDIQKIKHIHKITGNQNFTLLFDFILPQTPCWDIHFFFYKIQKKAEDFSIYFPEEIF